MVLSKILSRSDVLDLIWETVQVDSPDPTEPKILSRLSKLTHDLIDRSGRQALSIDPFSEVYKRKIIIDRLQIGSLLKNKVVLVTGGQGFVGTNLIAKLQQFGVKRIVSVDLSTDWPDRVKIDTTETDRHIPVIYYCSDVRDTRSDTTKDLPTPSTDGSDLFTQVVKTSIKGKSLHSIFAIERPQIVFHLAAERLP